MSDKKILVTICGPSTTGKSTLANLFKEDGYKEIVSTTTRPSRTGETDGVSYYFVGDNHFSVLKESNQLVEHEDVGKYSYGVSKQAIADVLNQGFPAVLVIAPKGANRVEEYCQENDINLVKVYVNNKMDLLVERLVKRYETDIKATDEVYRDRLWNLCMIEPKEWTAKAYSGEHHYDLIFDQFHQDNQHEVYASIHKEIERKINPASKSKNKLS